MDNQVETIISLSAAQADEEYIIDGIAVHLHYAREPDADAMETIERMLLENSLAG